MEVARARKTILSVRDAALPQMASKGRGNTVLECATRTSVSLAGREGESFFQRCQCVPLALPLSASLLHDGLNVSVPKPPAMASLKPSTHALGTEEH